MKSLTLTALMILLLPASEAAADYNFLVPEKCQNSVTGADGAETDDPPIVTITYTVGTNIYTVISDITLTLRQDKLWVASNLGLPPSSAVSYQVTTTYTPFLQSYLGIPNTSSLPTSVNLPPPSYNYQQIFAKVTITVNDQLGMPLRYAYLEMAPDFGGSSPYTMQADGNAKVEINCFTVYNVGGNPATVLDPNHNVLYSTNIFFDSSGAGVATPAH
jgi:hypothetical protein